MTGRIGSLVAFFRRAEPRGAAPTGWALALDGAVAVGAAIGAVYEITQRSPARAGTATVTVSGSSAAVQHAIQAGLPLSKIGLPLLTLIPAHASLLVLAAAALTALPLAWRRLYPITAWLVIIAAIVIVQQDFVPKVALGTAVYAAYSAIAYSRYRNLAIAVVSLATVTAAAEFGARFPRSSSPGGSPRSSWSCLPPRPVSASASCAGGSPTPPPGCAAPPPRPRPRRSGPLPPSAPASRPSCTTSSRTMCPS